VSAHAGPHPLTPIEGPSAFGGSMSRFRDLLWLTAVQDFRLQYRTSVLGYAWTLIRPLAYFGILYVVFSQIVRFGDTVPNYAVLLLLSIMLYQFFADATGTSVSSVVRGETVVRKMHFPRIVIPLAVVLSAAMTSGLNLVVVFGFMLAAGVGPEITWLLLPLILLPLIALSAGAALLLSTAYVYMRDISHVWTVALRVLFYATPILYPLELVPDSFRWVFALNPLTLILYQARVWFVQPDAPSYIDVAGLWPFVGAIVIGIGLCAWGLWLFTRQAPRVAEAI
jgi:ABC-2 type transport system permease protein